ncbi:MAG: ATP-binding protein [Nitrospira sp.]
MNTIRPERYDAIHTQPTHFFGLRLKFVLLFSLILIVTCSTLSWYFIETRRQAMTTSLEELGSILLTNTVRNDHFRAAGIVLEDRTTLEQFVQSLMTIDHVAYVMVTDSAGRILDQQSKRLRKQPRGARDKPQEPIYPEDGVFESLLHAPLTAPLMTRFTVSANQRLVASDESSDWLLSFLVRDETIFDFAMPVLREPTRFPQLSDELDEKRTSSRPTLPSSVIGAVRIGITDAQVKQTLILTVRNVLILTIAIIAAGIFGAHLLTSRVTTPIRSLARAARQLAEGNATPTWLTASSNDEVGQLTHAFSMMTQSLHERNQAITMNLETIKRQVTQLTTAHKVSAAIASANILNLDQLLKAVLPLLSDNLLYSKMAVLLYDPEEKSCSIAQVMGAAPEVAEAARQLAIPIHEGSIAADLLFHRKPFLIQDVEAAAHRFYPPILELLRRSGTRSIVVVPLLSQARVLGFLAGGRDTHPCREDDLDILLTIAGHVAAAIDNAKAYSELAELTQHLEERIEQRTEELSRANEQLLEHDRKRVTFLSVASHELRTPMTAIRSLGENLLDGVTGPLTDLQRTYLTRIKHNIARLQGIVNELLEWSRLNRIQLRSENVCIVQIATITVDNLLTVASDSKVSLHIELNDLPPLVRGDREKLEQILWNLIGNAIKFTPPGGRVTIEFSTAPPGFVRTCIADTGCGIDPSCLPNIFDEFSKVQSSMPTAQGAQLGLWITKTLVTMHDGEIWVESRPGVGSRFYFTLPIAASEEKLTPSISKEAEQLIS